MADPFYELKVDIEETLQDLKTKMLRFHGLQSGNVERKALSSQIDAGCQSLSWQVRGNFAMHASNLPFRLTIHCNLQYLKLKELDSAVDRASEDPSRYNLTNEELGTRRKWIEMTRRQIESLQEAIKGAAAAPPPPRGAGFYDESLSEERVREANNRFVGSELERQALITRQQDHQLDEIEMAVGRIGQMGRTIGEELESQQRILNALDEEMDTTQTRLKATILKINEIIRKSGGCSQLCVILVLLGVVIFLGFFLFS